MRRHLRRFLRVTDASGKRLFFRYYDPRVLRVYLPTCNEEELKTIYGPIRRFVLEGEDTDAAIEYVVRDGRLRTTPFQLRDRQGG